MNKIAYKWPKTRQQTVQQALFIEKPNNLSNSPTVIQTPQSTLDLGIGVVVIYWVALFYIYFSRYGYLLKNFKIVKSIVFLFNKNAKFSPSIDDEKTPFLHTLSNSFQHSEKIGTTALMFILLLLLTILYVTQNFIDESDPIRIAAVMMNYLIFFVWFLFLYIWQNEFMHMPLAFLTLIAVVLNSVFIQFEYQKFFNGTVITDITNMMYVSVSFSVFSMIIMACSIHINKKYTTSVIKWGTQFIAFSEALCLITFGIFLIYFIQLPPLPSENSLSCTMG